MVYLTFFKGHFNWCSLLMSDAKIRIYKPGPIKLIKCQDISVLNMGWSVLDIALRWKLLLWLLLATPPSILMTFIDSSDTSKMIYTSWSDKCEKNEPIV